MHRRISLFRSASSIVVIGAALGSQGCVSASDTHDVIALHAEAVDRMSLESAITNAALINATSALLAVRIERIVSDAEEPIIVDLIEPSGEPDHAALDRMIAQVDTPRNPLALLVRETRMLPEDAHDWLSAYAAALALPDGAATRRRLLESLYPVVHARTEAAALNTALRERARRNAMLSADARASAHSLLGASTSDPSIEALVEAAAQSWQGLLLESIDDPKQRDAAERLLESILGFTSATTTSTTSIGASQ